MNEALDKVIKELGDYKAGNTIEQNIADLHEGRENLAKLIAARPDPDKLKILHSIQKQTVGPKLWDTTSNGRTALHQPIQKEFDAIAPAVEELKAYRQNAVDVSDANLAGRPAGASATTQSSSPATQPVIIGPR